MSGQGWLEAVGRVLGAAVAAALLLVAGPLAAQVVPPDENEIQGRGFSPEKLYQFQDLDSINLFAGSLALSVPLGPSYPVNGNLSYQFRLTYNSGVWTYHKQFCADEVLEAIPNILSNAGLGFMVTFGYLIPPTHDPLNENHDWLYVRPDGGQTYLWDTLHEEDSDESLLDWFSRDGTYLRLQEDAGGLDIHELEFPDGTVHVFEKGPAQHDASIWEVQEIRDAFGNRMTIDRADPMNWVVSDDHLRTHRISFVQLNLPELPRPQIASITLEAFGDQDALYTFTYAELLQSSVDRGCRNTCTTNSPQVSVPLLVAVTLPSGEQYTFGTPSNPDYGKTCDVGDTGRLRSVTLPTLGKIAYTWGTFCTPRQKECDTGDPPEPPQGSAFTCEAAVEVRETFAATGVSEGQWLYDNGIHPPPGDCNEPATETRTVVVAPTGECAKHYFAAYPHLDVSLQAWSFGLPFSPSTPNGALYLSSESWEGFAPIAEPLDHFLQRDCVSVPAGGSALRSSFALYTHDTLGDGGVDGSGYHNSNRRLEQTKTIYHDDGGRFASVANDPLNFDAHGHYRETTYGGDFPGANDRTTLINFNPGAGSYPGAHTHPADDDAWILGTYDKTEVTEAGATARVEHCFEADTGFLARRRVLAATNPPGEASGDVLEVFDRDAEGNRDVERYFRATSNGALCGLSLPAFDYRLEHTYAFGALERSFYTTSGGADPTGTSIGFNVFDVDRDGSTGFVLRSRDASGQIETEFDYDTLGRLISETPTESPSQNRATTTYTYEPAVAGPPFAPARVTVLTDDDGGTPWGERVYEYDGFGRLAREQRRMPDGALAERTIAYDEQGRRERVSEWGPSGDPGDETIFAYDEFSRPVTITAPDGTVTSFAYEGVSQIDRTVQVQLDSDPTLEAVTTRETHDRFGRLRSVQETLTSTDLFTYGYDEGDRLVSVAADVAVPTPDQTRSFSYDGRGFLTQECHPEKGAPGTASGCIDYAQYDARGHALQTSEAGRILTFAYDKAERLTSLTDASGPVKELAYDDPSGTSRLDGRLREAKRHNRVDLPWDGTNNPVDVLVTETYAYGGVGAAVSSRQTVVAPPGYSAMTFAQGFTYSPVGGPDQVTYPDCTAGLSCPAPADEPALVADYGYTEGFLTAIANPAPAAPDWVTNVLYHPNALWSRIDRGNGWQDFQTIEAHGMRRPRQLTAKNAAGQVKFDTGLYAYDGAGNVTAIGTDLYNYDERSRLDGGTIEGANASFVYDPYGNLTQYTQGGILRVICTDSLKNRIAEPGQQGSCPGLVAMQDAFGNVTRLQGFDYEYDAVNLVRHRRPVPPQLKKPQGATEEPRHTYLYTADDERVWFISADGGDVPPGENGVALSSQGLFLRDLTGKPLRQYWRMELLGSPLHPYDYPWQVSRDYLWREGQLAAIEEYPGTLHQHLDHLGTPRAVSDAGGTLLESLDYWPYGEEVGSPSGNALQFTGHERDSHGQGKSDDLDYLHARYRSPVYARFLRVDPIGGNPRAPQSWNRYAYVLDNPLKYTDPHGLVPCGDKKDLDCEAVFAEEITVTAAAPANQVRATDLTGFLEFVGQGNSASTLSGGGSSGRRLVTQLPSNATLSSQAAARSEFAMMLLGQEIPGLVPVAGPVELGIVLATGGISSGLARGASAAVASGAPKITFGHGARHLIGTGLGKEAVEGEIARVVSAQIGKASATGSFSGRTVIGGRIIEYRAYTLPDGTINIGTFYPVP
jgi:RHS repeat-associated protein